MAYYIYENWQAGPHKTVIHAGECSFCKNGAGLVGHCDLRHAKWHGPFETLQLARAHAANLGGVVKRTLHRCAQGQQAPDTSALSDLRASCDQISRVADAGVWSPAASELRANIRNTLLKIYPETSIRIREFDRIAFDNPVQSLPGTPITIRVDEATRAFQAGVQQVKMLLWSCIDEQSQEQSKVSSAESMPAFSSALTNKPYRFNVAISFAGEQRLEAEQIAHCLARSGIKVFYGGYEKANLWGKNLYDHLADIYQNQAEYCIILASKEYAQKAWTTVERQSAQSRAFNEKGEEYILPVQFDGTPIPGVLPTVSYLDYHHCHPN